jgi:hypothetical protein
MCSAVSLVGEAISVKLHIVDDALRRPDAVLDPVLVAVFPLADLGAALEERVEHSILRYKVEGVSHLKMGEL